MKFERLGNVCTIRNGYAFDSGDFSETGIPVIRISNLSGGIVTAHNAERVKENTQLERFKIKKGDILIAMSGATTGKFAKYSSEEVAYQNQRVGCFINKDNNILSNEYLYFSIASIQKQIEKKAYGGAQPNISATDIENIKIPLPSLEDQQKIAYILSKAEALIQKRKETLKQLDEFLKSTFLDMFGDPVKNPKGWEKEKFRNVTTIFRDGPFGSNLKTEHYRKTGIRIIRLQNIGVGKFNDNDKVYISEEHFEKVLKRYACIAGDILIGTMGEPNIRACILPNSISLAVNKADCIQCRPNTEIVLPEYITSLLNTPTAIYLIGNILHGQTRIRVSMGQLAEIKIPIPPLQLQERFAKYVKKIEGIKQQQEASLKEIENLYHSLMQRGFKGELELGEVEVEKEKSDWNINSIQEKLTDVFHEIKKGSVPFGNSLKEFYDSAIQPQILKGSYISADYVEKLAKSLKKGLIENSSVIQELSGNNYSQQQIEQFANSVRIVDTTTDATESNFKLEFDSVETDFEEMDEGFVTEEEAKLVLDVLKTDMNSYLDSLPPINSKDKNLIKKIRDLDFQQKQAGKIEFDEDYAIYRVLEPHFSKEDSKSLAFSQVFELLKDFTNINYDVAKAFVFNDLSEKKTYFEQIYKEDHENKIYQVELKLKL